MKLYPQGQIIEMTGFRHISKVFYLMEDSNTGVVHHSVQSVMENNKPFWDNTCYRRVGYLITDSLKGKKFKKKVKKWRKSP